MQLLLGTPPQRRLSRRAGGLGASLALHGVAWVILVAGPPLTLEPATAGGSRAASASARDEEPIGAERALGVVPVDRSLLDSDVSQPAPDDLAQLELAGLRFDVARIRERREWLFPFLTGDLKFLTAIDVQAQEARGPFVNPFSRGRRADPSRPPLALSDDAMQAIVDRAWSRQHRWRRFAAIARLVRAHDPDTGELPALLRRYLDQNILQPYYDGRGRDARFWVMLGLSADHADFIDFVRSHARRHPVSRTTTELLFLLDELLQGSRDALLMLLATEPARDLADTASTDRAAHDLAIDIRRYYREWLRARGLDSADAVRTIYDQLRLRLLSTIVDATPAGYRSADARFLAGEIFFRQGNLAEAVAWWSAITPDPSDSYVEAYSELLPELRTAGSGLTAKAIAILGGEHGRWIETSRRRLRRFGYSFDTF